MMRPLFRSLVCGFAACAVLGAAQPIGAGTENGSGSGSLRPSYEPAAVPEDEIYTTVYLFGLSRLLARSNLVPAARVPLFLFTIPLDTALLPIALIAGFFPGD